MSNGFYNPPCWSIFQELLGSYLVFLILFFCRNPKFRFGIYIIGLILLRHQYCQLFVIGMMLTEYIALPEDSLTPKPNQRSTGISWGCMTIGLLLGSLPYYMTLKPEPAWLILGSVTQTLNIFIKDGPLTIAGTLLLIGVLTNQSARKVLSHEGFQYLGKISLSLYLLHFPLLCSFTSGLFIWLDRYRGWNYDLKFIIVFVASIPPLWLVSHYFYLWVDKPSMRFANRFGQTVMQWRSPSH
jgi:peptidoglycan/LPS O-acetylase OafA/YrhL